MAIHRRKVTIEWGDCDPAGIVYYPRYFEMFDAATADMIQHASDRTKRQLLDDYDVLGWPMVDTRARFILPSRFGDEITIETEASEIRRSSFDVRHRVLKANELAIEAFETRILARTDPSRPSGIKPIPLPETLMRQLRGDL